MTFTLKSISFWTTVPIDSFTCAESPSSFATCKKPIRFSSAPRAPSATVNFGKTTFDCASAGNQCFRGLFRDKLLPFNMGVKDDSVRQPTNKISRFESSKSSELVKKWANILKSYLLGTGAVCLSKSAVSRKRQLPGRPFHQYSWPWHVRLLCRPDYCVKILHDSSTTDKSYKGADND